MKPQSKSATPQHRNTATPQHRSTDKATTEQKRKEEQLAEKSRREADSRASDQKRREDQATEQRRRAADSRATDRKRSDEQAAEQRRREAESRAADQRKVTSPKAPEPTKTVASPSSNGAIAERTRKGLAASGGLAPPGASASGGAASETKGRYADRRYAGPNGQAPSSGTSSTMVPSPPANVPKPASNANGASSASTVG